MTQSNESNLEGRVNDHDRSLNQLIDLHFQAQRRAEAEMRAAEVERDRDRRRMDAIEQQIREIGDLLRIHAENTQAEIAQEREARQLLEMQSRVTFDRLGEALISLADTQQTYMQRTDAAIASLQASNERMDRLFDYLMRRDEPTEE